MGFQKGRRTRDQIVNIHWVIEKAREFRKKTSVSLTTLKPLTVWITKNWKILNKMRIPDRCTCLLRNLYAGQEAIVKIEHGTTDWFKMGKEIHQGYILSPCLLTYMQGTSYEALGLDESQARIKIAGRNISNLRYADDTI